jgi:hypothetical protein
MEVVSCAFDLGLEGKLGGGGDGGGGGGGGGGGACEVVVVEVKHALLLVLRLCF